VSRYLDPKEESGYSKAELEAYDKYWDSVSVEKTLLSGKYAEGLVEGHTKGLAEGDLAASLRITQNLLAKGISPEEISQITGLSIEQIKSLI
jgi:predicted transposase/invertase (TIGR01784 family)